MNFSSISFSRIYIFVYGLISFYHIPSLLGITETIISAPADLGLWGWHLALFLVFGALPIIAAFMNNILLLVVTGSSFAGMLLETLGVFAMTINLHPMFLLLDLFAVVLSLTLVIEKVSCRIAAEILSFEWSQY